MAPTDAKTRRKTTTHAKKRQRTTNNAKQRHLAPSSRCPGALRPAAKKLLRSRNFLGGKTDNPCEGKMTSRTQAPEQTISPEPDAYPAFVVHLEQITTWLQAGWSMKSIWQAYAARGAFPGSYRTFLRYCNEHGLAPRRPKGAVENAVNGRDLASPVERPDRIPPDNAALRGPNPVASANSARPSKIYAAPVSRPREFIPSEED